MAKKILFFIGAAVAASIVIVFVSRTAVKKTPAFIPPVYVSGESPTLLTRPLYIQIVSKTELKSLSSEQQKDVDGFKKKILSRIALQTPLSKEEKSVVSASISATTKKVIGNMVVADQSIFKFNESELKLISEALKK